MSLPTLLAIQAVFLVALVIGFALGNRSAPVTLSVPSLRRHKPRPALQPTPAQTPAIDIEAEKRKIARRGVEEMGMSPDQAATFADEITSKGQAILGKLNAHSRP